jgi:hypothetical protein
MRPFWKAVYRLQNWGVDWNDFTRNPAEVATGTDCKLSTVRFCDLYLWLIFTITLTAQQNLSPVGSLGASNLKDHKSKNYELKNQFSFVCFIDLKSECRNQIILVLLILPLLAFCRRGRPYHSPPPPNIHTNFEIRYERITAFHETSHA